jgi:hypothetical protein
LRVVALLAIERCLPLPSPKSPCAPEGGERRLTVSERTAAPGTRSRRPSAPAAPSRTAVAGPRCRRRIRRARPPSSSTSAASRQELFEWFAPKAQAAPRYNGVSCQRIWGSARATTRRLLLEPAPRAATLRTGDARAPVFHSAAGGPAAGGMTRRAAVGSRLRGLVGLE